MKRTVQKATWTIIISIILLATIFYKSLFFGENQKRQEAFHITPYTREDFQNKSGNNLYINLDSINNYNKYCHEEQKYCQIFPHQSRIADSIRLKSVQHAGQIQLDHTNLFEQLDTLTTLQPHWSYPYIFAQLFLTNKENNKISQKAILLGKKGISFLCNQSGCLDYRLPQNLAFNYYYYLQDIENSSNYYQLAASSPGAPTSLLKMPAIIMGRGGFHNKSAMMRYSKFINEKDEKLQIEYLNKALTEYTLDLITQSQSSQTKSKNICKQDLKCLQDNGSISTIIQNKITQCQQTDQTREEQANCALLQYGLDNNFIQKDGRLIYPIDPNMTYRRRTDVQDRRIILKTDI